MDNWLHIYIYIYILYDHNDVPGNQDKNISLQCFNPWNYDLSRFQSMNPFFLELNWLWEWFELTTEFSCGSRLPTINCNHQSCFRTYKVPRKWNIGSPSKNTTLPHSWRLAMPLQCLHASPSWQLIRPSCQPQELDHRTTTCSAVCTLNMRDKYQRQHAL